MPNNPEQHIDADGDGVGDTQSSGPYDNCPETRQNEIAMIDSRGCGPSERDTDYDSFTDDIDQCPNTPIMQTAFVNTTIYIDNLDTILNPYLGCALSEIDIDGDGVTADLDWDDNDANQSSDSDGDGFGDNIDAEDGDDCPSQKGTSTKDKRGCLDLDGDGWSVEGDFNDGDPTQWKDTDGDGFGDNWDNPDWSANRTIGEFVEGATEPDRCPNEYTAFLYSDTQGCLTSQNSNNIGEETSSDEKEEDDSSNTLMILGIAAIGIVFILFGSIAVLLRKKPSSRPTDDIGAVHPALEDGSSFDDKDESEKLAYELMQATKSQKSVEFVSTWEELPDGEWLPNDENGVNWYQDKDGRYWHSTDDGFKIWNE